MRSIRAFGPAVTGWQVLPADAPDFEEAALRATDLVLTGDPRIGKTPAVRRLFALDESDDATGGKAEPKVSPEAG